jgi:hypothetical protein
MILIFLRQLKIPIVDSRTLQPVAGRIAKLPFDEKYWLPFAAWLQIDVLDWGDKVRHVDAGSFGGRTSRL